MKIGSIQIRLLSLSLFCLFSSSFSIFIFLFSLYFFAHHNRVRVLLTQPRARMCRLSLSFSRRVLVVYVLYFWVLSLSNWTRIKCLDRRIDELLCYVMLYCVKCSGHLTGQDRSKIGERLPARQVTVFLCFSLSLPFF